MIFNYKHAPNLVATWRQEALRTTPERKITYLYLANDVIQQSRKKGSHFIDEYAKVTCLCHVHTQPDHAQHVAKKKRENRAIAQ
jgi:regulator of Ty1 transposition protein 103